MSRNTLVRQVMTTDLLTFHPSDTVETAARALAGRRIGGAPVVDDDGNLVGLLEDDDLIVQDARIHVPTVISVLGAYIELPGQQSRMEKELRKAVGISVADVMDSDPPTCAEDDTLETVATMMHEKNVSRLPVLRNGKLVGIIARGDVVRSLVADYAPPPAEAPPQG